MQKFRCKYLLSLIPLIVTICICFFGVPRLMAQDDSNIDSAMAIEENRLAQGIDEFGESKYSYSINIARELIASSTSPNIRSEARQLVLLNISSVSGYQAAIQEAESLKASIPSEGTEELNFLNAAIDDLKSSESQYQKAIASKQEIINTHPGTVSAVEADAWIAKYTLSARGLDGGIIAFDQLIEKYPNDKENIGAYSAFGRLLNLSGDYTKAKEILLRATSLDPNASDIEEIVGDLCSIYKQGGSYDEGIEALRSIALGHEISKMGSACALAIGNLYGAKGNPDLAFLAYKETIKRDPNSNSSCFAVKAINDTFISQNQTDKALAELARIILENENTNASAEAKFYSGNIYLKQGQIEQAEKILQEAMTQSNSLSYEIEPLLHDVYWKKAFDCQKNGDSTGAIEAWKKAYQYGKDGETIYLLLANLNDQSRYKETHTYAKEVLEKWPVVLGEWCGVIEFFDASAYYKEGDFESALSIFKRILPNAPDGQKKLITNMMNSIK